MVYDHKVKHNGILYRPGEDVPIGEKSKIKEREEPVEESPSPSLSVFKEVSENTNDKKYTKTEINRMNTADLQSLASECGIENAYEKSGADLKKILIEYFGL